MATAKKTTSKTGSVSGNNKTMATPSSALKASNDITSRDETEEDMSSMQNNSRTVKPSGSEMPDALKELFLDEIKDIYWAEKQLTKVLPKMQQAAASSDLADAIGDHLEETKVHVERLEQIFEILGEKAQAKKCDAMEGITKEGESIVEETEEGTPTRDAGVIMASQKVEHYEIATYGSLKQIATVLQLQDVANLLSQTLEEEKAADAKLTEVAESLNFSASEND